MTQPFTVTESKTTLPVAITRLLIVLIHMSQFQVLGRMIIRLTPIVMSDVYTCSITRSVPSSRITSGDAFSLGSLGWYGKSRILSGKLARAHGREQLPDRVPTFCRLPPRSESTCIRTFSAISVKKSKEFTRLPSILSRHGLDLSASAEAALLQEHQVHADRCGVQ
ncbi:hypothetical protein FKP32DRAFT_1379704 [Trametes sanguinea]|nr:hypothetical protein FKP32DRAFT_1379704 [Trametes sanguinea]